MPWIVDDVEEKIQIALGMDHLISLNAKILNCKSSVANEFLDTLTFNEDAEQGLKKLIFDTFTSSCEPFEENVVSRLAKMCPHLSHLQLS